MFLPTVNSELASKYIPITYPLPYCENHKSLFELKWFIVVLEMKTYFIDSVQLLIVSHCTFLEITSTATLQRYTANLLRKIYQNTGFS